MMSAEQWCEHYGLQGRDVELLDRYGAYVLEQAAQACETTRILEKYCVGRDLLTVDNGRATLASAAARIRALGGKP